MLNSMELPADMTIRIRDGICEAAEAICRCEELIRSVPGRRRVFRGRWDGQDVIIKAFCHKWLAHRHAVREWKSLRKLQSLGLSCPQALFYGQDAQGQWICASGTIANAKDVFAAFEAGLDVRGKTDILVDITREVAKQHSKGVLQKDMHLGNFLYDGKQVYALDTSQMRFFRKPIGINRSLAMLGLLCTNLPQETEKTAKAYFQARGWQNDKTLHKRLYCCIERARQAGLKRTLKKTLRSSKRYYRFKNGHLRGMFSRAMFPPAEAAGFAGRIDRLMEKGQILKCGDTCFVSRIKWNGRDVVVKRYNHKGFWHSLRHTLKGGRAKKCWLLGHWLTVLGIPCAKPIAFIEQRKFGLLRQSYIVNDFIEGPLLYDVMNRPGYSPQERDAVMQKARQRLENLGCHHFTHADMKPSNMILHRGQPVLIDLDSMQRHRIRWYFQYRYKKMVDRFEGRIYGKKKSRIL